MHCSAVVKANKHFDERKERGKKLKRGLKRAPDGGREPRCDGEKLICAVVVVVVVVVVGGGGGGGCAGGGHE